MKQPPTTHDKSISPAEIRQGLEAHIGVVGLQQAQADFRAMEGILSGLSQWAEVKQLCAELLARERESERRRTQEAELEWVRAVFNSPISGCVFAMPGATVSQQPVQQVRAAEPEAPQGRSGVCLNPARGMKIDFIRVMNALYELGVFQKVQGGRLTKKEFFTTMGQAVGVDLSNYDNDLSRSLTDSTALEKHLRIFDDMRQRMTEIFNSK